MKVKVVKRNEYMGKICPNCGEELELVMFDGTTNTAKYRCNKCKSTVEIGKLDTIPESSPTVMTVGDIDCPVCGQDLARLDEDCNGYSTYYCDRCRISIDIEHDDAYKLGVSDNDRNFLTAEEEDHLSDIRDAFHEAIATVMTNHFDINYKIINDVVNYTIDKCHEYHFEINCPRIVTDSCGKKHFVKD